MKTAFPLIHSAAIATLLAASAATSGAKDGIPQPQRYATLLAKAREGTIVLEVTHLGP